MELFLLLHQSNLVFWRYKLYKSHHRKIILISVLLISLFSKVFAQTKLDPIDVNGFDRLIMNPYSKTLDYAGTGFEVMTLLTPAVLFAAPSEDYWKIGVEYAETMAFAYGIKELAKHCVSRPRPYMYFDGAPQSKIDDGDWDDSFFSGHTTLSFAAASFTTFMMCQYFPDSPAKIPVITMAYSLACTTAILRLASGNHFLTDVLCGALAGSAIGFLVPWVNSFWLKPTLPDNCDLAVSPLGFSVCFRL